MDHNLELLFMFDHLSIGVSDFAKSITFYDAVFQALGIGRMFALPTEAIAGYTGPQGTSFWLYGKDKNKTILTEIQASPRFHVAFQATTRSAVDAFYQAAIAQGGTDEGAPGIRSHYHPNYYAAYVLDLDGYKLEAVCHEPG